MTIAQANLRTPTTLAERFCDSRPPASPLQNPFGPSNPVGATGIRNAYGLCFDPLQGTGYFTDPGGSCDDELNLLSIAGNYGWGDDWVCGQDPPGTIPPLVNFSTIVTPTGCCVYRGDGYPPWYDGNVFIACYTWYRIFRVKFRPGTVDVVDTLETFAETNAEALDVTVGPDGFLWYSTRYDIWRIIAGQSTGTGPMPLAPSSLNVAPNPFRESVSLRMGPIPADARLDILDLQGRLVRSWTSLRGGELIWDGRTEAGRRAPALLRLSGSRFRLTRHLVRVEG